jgi:hypothetical protein
MSSKQCNMLSGTQRYIYRTIRKAIWVDAGCYMCPLFLAEIFVRYDSYGTERCFTHAHGRKGERSGGATTLMAAASQSLIFRASASLPCAHCVTLRDGGAAFPAVTTASTLMAF